jgi:hypothetical protein
MSLGIVFDSILLQVTINLTSIAFHRLAVPETYGTSLVDIHDVVSVQQTLFMFAVVGFGASFDAAGWGP